MAYFALAAASVGPHAIRTSKMLMLQESACFHGLSYAPVWYRCCMLMRSASLLQRKGTNEDGIKTAESTRAVHGIT